MAATSLMACICSSESGPSEFVSNSSTIHGRAVPSAFSVVKTSNLWKRNKIRKSQGIITHHAFLYKLEWYVSHSTGQHFGFICKPLESCSRKPDGKISQNGKSIYCICTWKDGFRQFCNCSFCKCHEVVSLGCNVVSVHSGHDDSCCDTERNE